MTKRNPEFDGFSAYFAVRAETDRKGKSTPPARTETPTYQQQMSHHNISTHSAHEDGDGEKLEVFKEIVEGSQGKPILVFYNFQHDKSRIIKCLPKGLRIAELKGPGVISQWNERKIDVLLAHPASAAYGLNLQAGGNIIVWFGLNWSLELYQQANARLHRQGQTDNVIIHHLIVSGGMDEDVMAALQNKQVTQDSLLAALKARIAKVKGET